MSPAEVLLWQRLRGSPGGIRFRKQHPAGPFVLDFFCAHANLAIEVDGDAHNMGDRPDRDSKRDAWLREHRIEAIRIPARDVFADPDEVAQSIVDAARERLAAFGKPIPDCETDRNHSCP